MDFLDLAKSRFSVRSFKKDPVPDSITDAILSAANAAPTACDRQPQRIIVVKSEEGLELVRKCTECHFNAPLAFIICHDSDECWQRSYDGMKSGDIDAAIVTTHMMLEAASLGIGSTWVMYFIPEAVKEEFSLPDNITPTAMLMMGYPADDCKTSRQHDKRKQIEDTVTYR